jgi:glycerol-3-phosphate acyltransferase PlsY
VDIFSEGSGNPGATNINRTIGKCAGYWVFALDFFKGFIPSFALMKFCPGDGNFNVRMALLGLFGILCGHGFSIFHKFRGGKGISSAMGGLLAIMPNTLVVGALVWIVIFNATRIVSVASLCFTASVLLTSYLFAYSRECVFFALALNLMAFWKHRGNIRKLMQGTEYKFTKKK